MFPRLLTILVFTLLLFGANASAQTPETQGKTLFDEARVLAFQPEQSKQRLALEKFQEAARLFRQVGLSKNEFAAKLGAAFAAQQLGEYRVARELCIETLPFFDTPDQKYQLPQMVHTIAQLSLFLDDRPTAIKYFTRLLEIYKEIPPTPADQATMENDLGAVYYEVGQYDEALRYLGQALEGRRKLGNKCDLAATLTNLATVHQAKRQWSTALDLLKKEALPLYNVAAECALGDRDSANSECPNYQSATLINIGKIYYDTADYKSARCFYERALPLVTLKSFKAALFNNLGTIDYAVGNYPEALAWFQEAMKLHADIASAEALTNTVLTKTKQAKDISLSNLEAALRLRREIGSPNAEAATRNSIAELYNKLARPKDALSHLEVAIPQFRSAGDRSGEATALTNAMTSWRMVGDRKNALADGKQAVELFQTLRVEARSVNGEIERTYLQTVRQAYENTAELLIEEGLPEQAIEVLSLYRDTQSISGKRESIETSKLIAAQQALAANPSFRAVTLYTLVGESKFHVLAVTRDGIKVFSRPLPTSVLQQKVEDFLAVLQCAERSPYQSAAALYDLIFKIKSISDQRTTLETFLKTESAATLLWSLDHPLDAVPMAALYNATSKTFLIENYRTAVFTRGDASLFAREPGLWLTGIGLGTSKQFSGNDPIPGVEAALAAIFGDEAARRSGVLTGRVVVNENFTGKALEALDGHWPLVYIISHFVFDPGDSQASYLQLGNNTVYSLAQMRAQPDLFAGVELLAIPICESASAPADRYGKEIEAFADVAQQIGAKSVIGSLWKVSYHVTPHLMRRFYEMARANPRWSKAELLRQAQLDLLRGKSSVPKDSTIARGNCGTRYKSAPRFVASPKRPFAHPFYWSAFVLYGAPR